MQNLSHVVKELEERSIEAAELRKELRYLRKFREVVLDQDMFEEEYIIRLIEEHEG